MLWLGSRNGGSERCAAYRLRQTPIEEERTRGILRNAEMSAERDAKRNSQNRLPPHSNTRLPRNRPSGSVFCYGAEVPLPEQALALCKCGWFAYLAPSASSLLVSGKRRYLRHRRIPGFPETDLQGRFFVMARKFHFRNRHLLYASAAGSHTSRRAHQACL